MATSKNTNPSARSTRSKSNTKTIGMDFDFIPYYLRPTNSELEKKLRPLLPTSMNFEDLRQIAILMYKIMSIDLVQQLWFVYLKAGQGELQPTVLGHYPSIAFWPKEIRSLIRSSRKPSPNEVAHCLTFVNHCLKDLQNKSQAYHQELTRKTTQLHGYNRSLEDVMEKFLQKRLAYFRQEIEQEMTLIRYYYTDALLQQVALYENPTTDQIDSMKRLCKLKYHQQMTKYEVDFLQEKLATPRILPSFDCASMFQSLNTMQTAEMRQDLYQYYRMVAEQARNHLITLSRQCAQQQQQHYQQAFELAVQEMWTRERTLPQDRRLTTRLQQLLQQRLDNITARIECLYRFKRELFRLRSSIH